MNPLNIFKFIFKYIYKQYYLLQVKYIIKSEFTKKYIFVQIWTGIMSCFDRQILRKKHLKSYPKSRFGFIGKLLENKLHRNYHICVLNYLKYFNK